MTLKKQPLLILALVSLCSLSTYANTCANMLDIQSGNQPDIDSFFDVEDDYLLSEFALYGDGPVDQLSTGEKVEYPDFKDFKAQIKEVEARFSDDQEDYSDVEATVEGLAVVNGTTIVAYGIRLTGVDQNDSNYDNSIVVDADFDIRYENEWSYSD